MTRAPENDAADVLRFALGGAVDEATRRIERSVEEDPELRSRVETWQIARDVIRMDADGGPSAEVADTLRALLREVDPLPPREEWLFAAPAADVQGVRAVGDLDSTLYTEAEEFELTVAPRWAAGGDRCGVDGQVVGADGEPLAGVEIVWIVDELKAASARTDELGEFSFEETPGSAFGLLVRGPGWERLIHLGRDAG